MTGLEAREGRLYLTVRVQPRASQNALRVEPDGRVRVTLTAPPIEGAANKALRAFIAEVMGVRCHAVTLVQGGKSRDKVLCIEGIDRARAETALALGQR